MVLEKSNHRIHFSKELALRFNLKTQDINSIAKIIGVRKTFGSYYWTDKNVRKLERIIPKRLSKKSSR